MSTATTCDRADAWIALEHAGALTHAQLLRLEAHVANCESCGSVRAALPAPTVTSLSQARRTRRTTRVAVAAGVFVLAAAAIAGIYVGRHRDGDPMIARDSPTAAVSSVPTVTGETPAVDTTPSAARSTSDIAAPPTDSAKRAPQRASPASPSASALTPGQISMVLAKHRREINECWRSRERKAEEMGLRSLRVDLTLSVAAAGRVERAEQRTSDRRLEDVGKCIANAAKGWTFPETLSSSTVRERFSFSASPGY